MKRLRLFMIFALLCAVAQGTWATDYNVSNEAELRGAISNGANITLTRDINIVNAITFNDGITVTINLGGHTLNRNSTNGNHSQVIGVFSGSTLNISNGTLTGGWGGDGGILNQATLNMTNVTISGNKGNDRGGGISNNGTLTMTDCTVSNNTSLDATSPAGGGGIFNYEGKTATLTNCTITGNTTNTYGGGGICNYGTMTLNDCSLSSNNATTKGGGIFCSTTSTLSINGCDITGNSAVSYGDGIYIDNSTLNMQGLCTVKDNNDGNIYLYGSGTKITVTGAFTTGSKIGVGFSDYDRKFTSGYSTYNSGTDPGNFFSSDNYKYAIGEKEGEAYPGITYWDHSWEGGDTDGHVVNTRKVCTDYSEYNGETSLSNGWYVLTGTHTYNDRPACHGDVKFILVDGSDTEFKKGIHIDNPQHLTIYAQDNGTGKLRCTGDGGSASNGDAAIGGNNEVVGGNLVIHGGDIYAYPYHNDAAGIGGGDGNSGMQSITIWDGIVTAKGRSSGAGIGCGNSNGTIPDVTIYGGTITAEGGKYSAGIGGGDRTDSGKIKIYGGTITTSGGLRGSGIGSGYRGNSNEITIYGGTVTANCGEQGAGIGSACGGHVEKAINIYSGTITATGGESAAGIGSGYCGSNNGEIYIHGGKVYATGGKKGAGIGGGQAEKYGSGDNAGTAREFYGDFDDNDFAPRHASRRSFSYRYGSGGNIYIYGGYVEAYGGQGAAGIGCGYYSPKWGHVYVYDGTVKVKVENSSESDTRPLYLCKGIPYDGTTVIAGSDSMARGFDFDSDIDDEGDDEAAPRHALHRASSSYENYGYVTLGNHLSVSKGSSRVSSGERYNTCISHPSDDSVILTITSCDHSGRSYSIKNDSQHKLNCSYCSAGSTENHNTDGENGSCSLCGYGSGSYTLSFYEANATANGYGDATEYTMGKGVTFKLPECSNVPDKMVFAGWKKVTSSESAPTSIEADDSELSSLKAAGSSITISADMGGDRYYARYQTCWKGDGTGALDDPFLVQTKDDWDYIASKVNNSKITYSGKYFKMTDNIGTTESPVSNFIGTSSTKFAGSFNGGRKTLTVIYSFVDNYCAPFRYVNGATIMNLRVDGTLTTSAKHAGGVIGYAEGTNTINNCRVHATINNTKGSDGSTGGFVGYNNGTVNFTRCIFDGKLSGSSTTGWGGFVGWNAGGAKVNITNCLFKPDANSDAKDGCTFARCQTESDMTITNSYYTQVLGTAQGTQAYTVESYDSDKMWLYYGQLETDEEDEAIAALEYRENEVFVFDTGLLFQKIFYTGGTTAVTFTPLATEYGKMATDVTANSGTLTDNDDGSYTLTMNNANSTVTATITDLSGITLYDGSNDPTNKKTLEENEDKIMNVTISGRKLYKDGDWNTLCLPFDVSAEKISANSDLSGATIMELDTEGWYDSEGNRYDEEAEGRHQTSFASDGTLYLYFLATTSIDAGVPCLVKWTTTGDPITLPTFYSSYIESSSPGTVESADGKVQFIGNYDPETLTGGDKSNYYLGTNNQLYYPSADRTMNSFRGYFHVDLSEAPAGARAFVLNFGGNGETTGILSTTDFTDYTDKTNVWYDLQGRKLNGKPSQKGVYINNGKKQVIK